MNQKLNPLLVIAGGVFFFLMLLSSQITVTIKPGERAIIFRKFTTGLDKEHIMPPGFHFIAPWNEMVAYDVTQQEIAEVLNVLSSNGLEIKVDVSIWFRPDIPNLGYLHSEIRENLKEMLFQRLINRKNLVTVDENYILKERNDKNEDDISFKVHPLSHPPTDKSNSDDGEHQLKHAEEIFRDGARKDLIINTYKENFAQIPDKMSNIVTKG